MNNQDLKKLRIEREEEELYLHGQNRKRFLWFFFIPLLLAGSFFLLNRLGIINRKPEVTVTIVSEIYPSEVYSVFHASGYVVAQRKAAVASKGTGRLAYLGVEEGSIVKKGQVIGILEKADLEAAVQRAKANLRTAKAQLKFDRAGEKDARKQFHRFRVLLKGNVVSKSSYDQVEARYSEAVASVRADYSRIEAAEAALKEARVALEYAYIRAPFDGIVLKKFAEVGEVVAPFGSATNAKAAVVTLADIHSLMVEADVAESNITKVKIGQPCEIQLDAFPGKRFRGEVHMIVPTADRAKETITVKVKFIDWDKRIMPEMSSRVSFLSKRLDADELKPRLLIPENAFIKGLKSPAVFILVKDRLVKTYVKRGLKMRNFWEIIGGLKVGERIVVNPDINLKTGQKVRVAGS